MSSKFQLWLGSQESFEATESARIKAESHFQARTSADNGMEDSIYNRLVTVQNGVGILTVGGSLVNGSAGYMVYYGVTGYDDLRNALGTLAGDPSVNSILINMSSGGGDVAGCLDCAQMLARVAAVKPVVTYTGSTMCSAALWFGVSASYVMAGETAIVGSLGVIMVHAERSAQLAQEGIKVTVIRSGDEKALANSYEPLTEAAKADMQAKADTMKGIFLGYVANARGQATDVALAKYGQGKEFVGKQAMTAGLVDKIGSFEDAYAKAAALGSASMSKRTANKGKVQAAAGTSTTTLAHNSPTRKDTDMTTQAFTAEQLEALAAGVDVAAQADATPENLPEVQEVQASLTAANEELVAVKASVESLTAEVATLKAEAEALKAQADTEKPQFSAAIEIVRNAVRVMGLPFNADKNAVASMSAVELLAEHPKLAEKFKTLKVGGVAATTQEAKPVAKTVFNPMFAAVMLSTQK